jgi:hypothetical protein
MKKLDVFSFIDFMNNNEIDNSIQILPNNESILIDDTIEKEKDIVVQEDIATHDDIVVQEDIATHDDIVVQEDIIEYIKDKISEEITLEIIEDDTNYTLYKDINEEFICDISIEGASIEEAYARIIIETTEWSLVFPGNIVNNKCIVPIKKLGILNEGDTGNIKLEVVADGNLFIPWSDTFKIKLSKKVTVNLDENAKVGIPMSNVNVKVNVIK